MRRILVLSSFLVALCSAQWVEAVVEFPDSLSGMNGIGAMVYHAPSHAVYVGGSGPTGQMLIPFDAQTSRKLAKISFQGYVGLLCSSPGSNKIYGLSTDFPSIYVFDGATNRYLRAVRVDSGPSDICCDTAENKVYVACSRANSVNVIDCATDSVRARIPVSAKPGALCYNPVLRRVYCACRGADEVAVIDCSADSVIGTVWVRGVGPGDVCCDSATNRVYTANSASNTVSEIDCIGDTLLRLIPVGGGPFKLVVAPSGKVYCANWSDTTLSVITPTGVKTIPVGGHPEVLSCDPLNAKVYCSREYDSTVLVFDAVSDSLVARVDVKGTPWRVCYNPAVGRTCIACEGHVAVIDGTTNLVTAVVTVAGASPGPLCYDPTGNKVYCGYGGSEAGNAVAVIDGDRSVIAKRVPFDVAPGVLAFNSLHNKIYVGIRGRIAVLSGVGDSVVAVVELGATEPQALCYSAHNDRLYCGGLPDSLLYVVDGVSDSVVAAIPLSGPVQGLCYDPVDDKVYCERDWRGIDVVDCPSGTMVATLPIANSGYIDWNQNHDKLYVCSESDTVTAIDCSADTIVARIPGAGSSGVHSDTVMDRVYCSDIQAERVRVIDPSADTLVPSMFYVNGYPMGLTDNGLPEASNRVYCLVADDFVAVLNGATNRILRTITVGPEPASIAWNPVHGWAYVAADYVGRVVVIRDSLQVGIAEEAVGSGQRKASSATVVRGALFLPPASGMERIASCVLLDISGRKVLDLKPGPNDVRALAPGVYFVRQQPQAASLKPQAVRKVVVTR